MKKTFCAGASLALAWSAAHASWTVPPAVVNLAANPAANFFRAPDFSSPAVAPDGANVVFIARQNGHSRLFHLSLATGKMDGIFDPGEGEVEAVWWLDRNHLLIAGTGERGYSYFTYDFSSTKTREIRAFDRATPDQVTILSADPQHVMVCSRANNGFWDACLTRVNVATDRSEVIDSSVHDPRGMVLSATGEERAKASRTGDTWHIYWRLSASQPWSSLNGSTPDPAFWPLAMAPNDRDILVVANDQGDTTALMSLDPVSGQRKLLAQRPDRDIYRLIVKQPDRSAAGLSFYHPGNDDLQFIDSETGRLLGGMAQTVKEPHKRIASSSADGSIRIVEAWNSGQPSSFYLLDHSHHRLSKLADQYDAATLPPLGTVRYFEFTTRDGVKESGSILMPHDGAGPHGSPVLLIPAGYVGEENLQSEGFDGPEQYFASRGIAVTRLLVRGSRGLGKAFQEAGDFKVAETVLHDYEDGLAYLSHEGLIDSQRVAIMGFGWSGLLALKMASVGTTFKAAIVQDCTASNLTAIQVYWMTGRGGSLHSLIERAGGSKAAYSLVHEFAPSNFLGHLSAIPLVVYTSDYQLEYLAEDAGAVRDALRRFNKPYEWYRLDVHDLANRPWWYYQTVLQMTIGDFLVKNLDVPAPGGTQK